MVQASNTYNLTVNVTDSIVTVGQSFTMTVNQNSATIAPYIINETTGHDIITIAESSSNLISINLNGTTTNVTLAAGRCVS